MIVCEPIKSVRVNCTTQSAPLGIPLGEKSTLYGVLGAVTTDYEGLAACRRKNNGTQIFRIYTDL